MGLVGRYQSVVHTVFAGIKALKLTDELTYLYLFNIVKMKRNTNDMSKLGTYMAQVVKHDVTCAIQNALNKRVEFTFVL